MAGVLPHRMDPFDILIHLLNFVAPALGVAALLVPVSRFLMRNEAPALAWWAQFAINFVVGAAVLLAGLAWFGRDGKMASYAALVCASALCQWVLLRGWRR